MHPLIGGDLLLEQITFTREILGRAVPERAGDALYDSWPPIYFRIVLR